jgi:hypothetical protein
MSVVARPQATDPRVGGGWGSALTIATRCVLILIGIGVAIQTFIVVEARPQDLITGIHGMADLIWRAIPPDFSKLPAAFWPTSQTVDIALFGTLIGIIIALPLALTLDGMSGMSAYDPKRKSSTTSRHDGSAPDCKRLCWRFSHDDFGSYRAAPINLAARNQHSFCCST